MKKWLKGKLPDREVPAARQLRREISLESVVAAVSAEYSVSHDKMKFRSIKHNEPRDVAIYLCRKWVRASIVELGNYFGAVTGSAISNIVKTMQERIKSDSQLCARIEAIGSFIDNSSFKT